jgi:hypothetical protein
LVLICPCQNCTQNDRWHEKSFIFKHYLWENYQGNLTQKLKMKLLNLNDDMGNYPRWCMKTAVQSRMWMVLLYSLFQECGGVCCYADDSIYTAVGSDSVELSEKHSHKCSVLADFLTPNKLKVNDEKTHLLVMSTRQKRAHRDTSTLSINTPTAIITPSEVQKLLGANFTKI